MYETEVVPNGIGIKGLKSGKNPTEIMIPATIDGTPVVAIGDDALKGRTELKSVYLTKGVTDIGASAFYGCVNLTSFDFESGSALTYIGIDALKGDNKLTNINYIPSGLEYIGAGTFSETLWIRGQLTDGNYYTVGKNLILAYRQNVGENDFVFDTGAKVAGDFNVYGNVSIGAVIIAGGAEIAEYSFAGINLHTLVFTDNSSLKSIPIGAFNGCTSLTSVTFGKNLLWIQQYAFQGCVSLTELVLTESLAYIGDEAFAGCSALKSIQSPKIYPSELGAGAFDGIDPEYAVTVKGMSKELYTQVWGNIYLGIGHIKADKKELTRIEDGTVRKDEQDYYAYLEISPREISGMLFSHWTDDDGNEYGRGSLWTKSLDEEWVLTAVYTPNLYKIIFGDGNGTTDSEMDVLFRGYYEINENYQPIREHYKFGGWFYNEKKVGYAGTWEIPNDALYEAAWTPIEYTATFQYNYEFYAFSDVQIVYDVETGIQELPTAPVFGFNGWAD
jgi:hypothetical protein